MNQSKTIQWGILSTARIATRVVDAITATDHAHVKAVASRTARRAEIWAKQHQVAQAYDNYDALLGDEDLDAVYIPLPPSMHAEWTIRAAEAGKHVLCEKPLAMTAVEAEAMAAACRANNVQLMDATMWVHHPRTAVMFRAINDERFGPLRRVTSAFSFDVESYLQMKPPHLALDQETAKSSRKRSSPMNCDFNVNLAAARSAISVGTTSARRCGRWAASCRRAYSPRRAIVTMSNST